LTSDEEKLLEVVFCVSVKYNFIRIIKGRAGIFSLSKRPFTLGNKIYMRKYHRITGMKY